MMRAQVNDTTGYSPAFLNCGGIGMPPYAVRYRGRWYVTEWLTPDNRNTPSERPEVIDWVRSLGVLRFGTRRFLDAQARSNKHWHQYPRAADLYDRKVA